MHLLMINHRMFVLLHVNDHYMFLYDHLFVTLSALYGPLHGGANEAVLHMLEEIAKPENVPQFLQDVKNKKRKLMGFGHRVYKNYDPRAKILKGVAKEVFEICGKSGLWVIAEELEKQALQDEYFVSRKLFPNIDFYSGLIYQGKVLMMFVNNKC